LIQGASKSIFILRLNLILGQKERSDLLVKSSTKKIESSKKSPILRKKFVGVSLTSV